MVRWAPRKPFRILALRDELTSRVFDDPGPWWPDQPDVVGGRDRVAGGTWCASNVRTGVTALVLNRPHKRVADDQAPSRGVLPLLAVAHEHNWTAHIDPTGMASFAVVLVTPARLTTWDFDGTRLIEHEQPPGTHMTTSGGVEDGKADRYLATFEQTEPGGWRTLIRSDAPSPDLTELVVRRERDGVVYATVFGQLIASEPGRLQLDYSRTPWLPNSWTTLSQSL